MNARVSTPDAEPLLDPVMIPGSPWHATLFGVCASSARDTESEDSGEVRIKRTPKPKFADAATRSKHRKQTRRDIEARMIEVVAAEPGISSGRIVDKLLEEYPEFAMARMHNVLTKVCDGGDRISRTGNRGSYKHYIPGTEPKQSVPQS